MAANSTELFIDFRQYICTKWLEEISTAKCIPQVKISNIYLPMCMCAIHGCQLRL